MQRPDSRTYVKPLTLAELQCNWLYELDDRDGLLSAFDAVVNSYEEGYTKRDSEIFRIACQRLDVFPEETVFFRPFLALD